MLSKRIKKIIQRKKVVSFDIFDTLLFRNCLNSNDIFDFVELKYNAISNNKIQNFKSIREKAYLDAKQKLGQEEVSLNQIYDCINNKYDKNLLLRLEIEVDNQFCSVNDDVKEIYDYAVNNKKRIICVSDMYYNANVLHELLKKNGVFIDEIYVSCEFKCKKSSGSLFKEIIKKTNINPKEIVHFGDSEKGDFIYPKFLGIKTVLIRKKMQNIFLMRRNIDLTSRNNNIIFSLCNNCEESNYFYRYGYEMVGPICLYFCKWLNENFVQANSNALFCARDMKLMYNFYNIIYNDRKKINNKYFYVSRRSLRLPYLYKNNSFESFTKSFTDNNLNVFDILDNLNLLDDDVSNEIKKMGFSSTLKFNSKTSKDSKELLYLYNNILKNKIASKGKKELSNLNLYLNEINSKKNNLFIVDMGWKGTTQKMMMNLYPNKMIKGLYFGVDKSSNYDEIKDNNSKGYLFYKEHEVIKDLQFKIYSFRDLFEKIFSDQEPSTIRYSNRSPYYVLGESLPKEESIELIQKGVIAFAKSISNYMTYFDDNDNYEYVKILVSRMINPNLKLSITLGNIYNDNMYNRKMASPKNIFHYLFHLNTMIKDIRESGWKIGFMKRILRIKFPYYLLYKKLYNSKMKGE